MAMVDNDFYRTDEVSTSALETENLPKRYRVWRQASVLSGRFVLFAYAGFALFLLLPSLGFIVLIFTSIVLPLYFVAVAVWVISTIRYLYLYRNLKIEGMVLNKEINVVRFILPLLTITFLVLLLIMGRI